MGWSQFISLQVSSALMQRNRQNVASGFDKIVRPWIWIHSHPDGPAEPNACYLGIWWGHGKEFRVEDVHIKKPQEEFQKITNTCNPNNWNDLLTYMQCFKVRIQVRDYAANKGTLTDCLLPLILFSFNICILWRLFKFPHIICNPHPFFLLWKCKRLLQIEHALSTPR